MARRVADVTITREGRDQGKVFRITEMPTARSERWATRALLALGKAMPDIPEDYAQLGLLGLARFGISAFLSMDFGEATALLDEMMTCVQVVPSANVVRALVEDDIEEVATLVQLRDEVFKIHTGFSLAARLSTSDLAAAATSALLSTSTPTSQDQSGS